MKAFAQVSVRSDRVAETLNTMTAKGFKPEFVIVTGPAEVTIIYSAEGSETEMSTPDDPVGGDS